jgi:hypothetical protein
MSSAGYYRRGKPNRPKRLTKLQLEECSVVDNAANPHAKVVFLKRERSANMPTVTPEQVRNANFELTRKANAAPTLPANHYEELMKRTAVSAALEVYQAKQPFSKSRTNPTTTARYYQSKPGDNGDGMDDVDWPDEEGSGGLLDWSKIDWNNTEQAAKAHRAEQARKAREADMGSHQDENTGPRSVTGARLNPKAVSP